ncbi:Bll5565 protein [hydrothermal vent metagenome]|uniref:Bll5565 protein n=1 Tax=hydrothermal vent metagenome TaxID=652676 RepID=A0A1W1BH67_9ZZZZ
MNFLQKIAQRLLLVIQFILVFLFILFEELIWEGIAKPIYNKIESLHITQKIEEKISQTNRYLILLVFLLFLFSVEGAGLLAGLFFIQGKVLFGLILYITKIPIAAFVFWLFKVSKKKLLSFLWFKWAYNKIMSGLDWLKDLEIYKSSMAMILSLKERIKKSWKKFKDKYFDKDSSFTEELKSFYNYMKNFKKNIKKRKEDKND